MELLQLHYFCTAARLENLTKAAREHNIPQSAMSKTISRLEQELGVPLFARTSNSLKLNEKGRILYRHVKDGLGIISGAVQLVQENTASNTTLVKICAGSFSDDIYSLIMEYAKAHEGYSFEVSSGYDGSVHNYDFYLCPQPAQFGKGFEKTTLFSDPISLAVSSSSRLGRLERVCFQDICGFPCILFNKSEYHAAVEQTVKDRNLSLDILARIDISCDLFQSVASGMAISFAPQRYAAILSKRDILLKPLYDPPVGLEVCLFSNMESCRSQPKLDQFRNFLIDSLREAAACCCPR